jgi:hypothetical protein
VSESAVAGALVNHIGAATANTARNDLIE